MQKTLSELTDIQGYIKIGRCISTGDLVFLPADSDNTVTDNVFNTATPCEYMHFDPYFMFNELLSDKEVQNVLFKLPDCYGFFPKEHFPDICFLAELIFTEFHNKKALYEDSMRGLLLSLLSTLTRTLPLENKLGKSDSLIQSALLFIHNNYADNLSVSHMAKHCFNMSESHFRRKFHEVMNISPLDYINTLRVHKACQLLYHSEMHINEIATAVGFTTLSSFNRQFLSLTGTSPSQWRKTHTGPMSQIQYTVTNT